MTLGCEQLDVFVDSKLECFVTVHVDWQLRPFRWFESGVCGTSLLILCYATEASMTDTHRQDEFHTVSICDLIKRFSLVMLNMSIRQVYLVVMLQ